MGAGGVTCAGGAGGAGCCSVPLTLALALTLLVVHVIAYHHWKEEIKSFQTI